MSRRKTPITLDDWVEELCSTNLSDANKSAIATKFSITVVDLEARVEALRAANHEETTLVLESFSVVVEEPVEWLWQQKIPLGVLVVFSGNPDCGKTTVTIDLIARYTTGQAWPDDSPNHNPISDVLMLIAEDDPARTIKPRLMAAGADTRRVHYLKMVEIRKGATRKERGLALDTDLTLLKQTLVQRPEIKLVVTDPITGYFGNAHMNKEQEIRAILEPLKKLCEELKLTFLALGHFNKRSDVVAMHRVSGAVAMTGVPRAVWAFGPDPDVKGEYLMTMVKGNLAKDKSGMRFRFIEKQVKGIGGQPVIDWIGKSEKATEDMIERKDPELRKKDKAVAFLQEALKGGPQLSSVLFEQGEEKGLPERTLWRAKKAINGEVQAKREGGKWYWRLTPVAAEQMPLTSAAPDEEADAPF